MKPPKNLIVECDGELYVRVDAIMSPLVSMIDGLKLSLFGKKSPAYLSVKEAIDWCQKEREHHSREKYDKIIENLKAAEVAKQTPEA